LFLCIESHVIPYDLCAFTQMPHMNPFPLPNSVLVLDNATIHRKSEVTALMAGIDCLVVYLPPYTPQYNPIESLFGKYKQWLKTNRAIIPLQPASASIRMALASITEEDCMAWIESVPFYL
jgi:transposase